MSSARTLRPTLVSGVIAFVATPPLLAVFLAIMTAMAGNVRFDVIFGVIMFGITKGLLFAAPVAFLLAVVVGDWCSSNYQTYSRFFILSVSTAFTAAGGAVYGRALEFVDGGSFIGLSSALLPIGAAVGGIVGCLVAFTATALSHHEQNSRSKLTTHFSRRRARRSS